jgi:hypothetical protein
METSIRYLEQIVYPKEIELGTINPIYQGSFTIENLGDEFELEFKPSCPCIKIHPEILKRGLNTIPFLITEKDKDPYNRINTKKIHFKYGTKCIGSITLKYY